MNSELEDRFEGDPSTSLDVPRDVPDGPLPQTTEEADDLSEVEVQLKGG